MAHQIPAMQSEKWHTVAAKAEKSSHSSRAGTPENPHSHAYKIHTMWYTCKKKGAFSFAVCTLALPVSSPARSPQGRQRLLHFRMTSLRCSPGLPFQQEPAAPLLGVANSAPKAAAPPYFQPTTSTAASVWNSPRKKPLARRCPLEQRLSAGREEQTFGFTYFNSQIYVRQKICSSPARCSVVLRENRKHHRQVIPPRLAGSVVLFSRRLRTRHHPERVKLGGRSILYVLISNRLCFPPCVT